MRISDWSSDVCSSDLRSDLDEAMGMAVNDGGIISQLTVNDILGLLEELPLIHRMVFNLTEIEGFGHEEVAKKLNIPSSSSRVYLTREKKARSEARRGGKESVSTCKSR